MNTCQHYHSALLIPGYGQKLGVIECMKCEDRVIQPRTWSFRADVFPGFIHKAVHTTATADPTTRK